MRKENAIKAPRGQLELEDLEVVFKALAHATRRHILIVLNARGGSMTAGMIAKRFSCRWPTTSRHLRRLQEAGLVEVKKDGREWVYRVCDERILGVAGNWINWFDNGEKGGRDD